MKDCATSANEHDCCHAATNDPRPPTVSTDRLGRWSTPAAIGSAIFSSACCWLPLLLLALGLSAGGVAGFFEKVRPFFLIAAVIFLAAGFYFAYLRRLACQPNDTCATPNARLQRFNRSMLWVATAFVIAFALFPYYSPAIVRGWASPTADSAAPAQGAPGAPIETVSRTYPIDGMTCRGCATTLELELAKLPGVVEASVSYEQGSATLRTRRESLDRDALQKAVERAGFRLAGETSHESE